MFRAITTKTLRKRRTTAALMIAIFTLIIGIVPEIFNTEKVTEKSQTEVLSESTQGGESAIKALENLEVKGRAPKTGYSRSEFGDGWANVGSCDMRNIILKRGITDYEIAEDGCVVLNGTLNDPYTNTTINFVRGSTTSDKVQIDHVVALSDAWQKGAQNLSYDMRVQLANDPLELLAVDGPTNQKKGDSDAASWLPPNKDFRCQYVARQIAVKVKYNLWVTEAEKAAMQRVLNGCKEQVLPIEQKK